MAPVRRRATYEDLLRAPEHLVAEILDGELIATPRPASPHARAASGIGSDIWGPFDRPPGSRDRPGGWWILFEPELHLGADVVVPDLAGWKRQRMPVMPDVAFFDLAPDWICEVVSPKSAAIDRGRKMHVYAREGTANLWMVDPIAKTVEVYRLEAGSWMVASTHAGQERIRAEPFDAVEFDISRWWLDPSPVD